MKLRLTLAASMAAAALFIPAAIGHAAVVSPKPLNVVNLHAARAKALTTVPKHVPRAGIVPARGTDPARLARPAKSPAPASCTEPNCNLKYNGGPVQHSPHVYLLFWGPDWSSSDPVLLHLISFYQGLGAAGDNWSKVTSQYGDGTGHPSFAGSVYAQAYQDTSTPPNPVGSADVAAEADALASQPGVTVTGNTQIIVVSQSGTCFDSEDGGFAGSCGTPQPTGYCAWHSYDGVVSFTNLPYQLDAGIGCGENFINSGSAGTLDGFSIVGGHEYAESITDPTAGDGWWDFSDPFGGEIGDKCVWGGIPFGIPDPDGNVHLSTGSFAMQSLWSNAAHKCVMRDKLTLTHPPNMTTIKGRLVNYRMHAVSSIGSKLTWAITGQPTGLHITSGGLITGRPTRVAVFHVKVTVHDAAGSSAVASWVWTIKR
jgi:serine protease